MENIDSGKRTKELRVFELIAIGVGGMIGGGIFSVLGLAVGISGHAASLAFAVGSLIAISAGYSYIRLALTYRKDGASFTYLERAFPKKLFVAGIAGWIVVVGYIGTLALYAFTFGAYASHLFGADGSRLVRILLSILILGIFMGINILGTKLMGRAEDIIVYIKIFILALIGGVGFFTLNTTRFSPLLNNGVHSVFMAGALIFVAFEGFQLITNAVEETQNPDRNIPIGLYGSIVITSIIYIAIAIVAVGNLDLGALLGAKEYALAVVAEPVLGRVGVLLVDIAALFATSSAINGTLFGASRLASEIAIDSLAPRVFAFHNHTNIPVVGIIIITLLASILTIFGGLEFIASFSSMTFLLVSIAVNLANLRLYKATRSKLFPIIVGLVLMSITIVLLIIFMAHNTPWTLLIIACIYGTTGVAHMLFERLRTQKKVR
jgi:amino acid transporter